jgi:hypothetical protein
MLRILSLLAVLAGALCAALPVQAFHHHHATLYAYPGYAYTYCWHGHAGNINYLGGVNIPYGYGYPLCSYGTVAQHRCCLAPRSWFGCCHKHHAANGRCTGSSCGCGSACSGCCGIGGCSVSSQGAAGIPSDAKVISDRTLGEETPAETTAPDGDHSASWNTRTYFHLTADQRRDGSGAFQAGVISFRSGSYSAALVSFEAAAASEPGNALYRYYLALAQLETSGAITAEAALAEAVQLESREPIANWGKQMERVQGRGRLWIEKARREAGLVR